MATEPTPEQDEYEHFPDEVLPLTPKGEPLHYRVVRSDADLAAENQRLREALLDLRSKVADTAAGMMLGVPANSAVTLLAKAVDAALLDPEGDPT